MTTDNFCFYLQDRLKTGSKPVKQEVNGTMILPPLVFPALREQLVLLQLLCKLHLEVEGLVKRHFQKCLSSFAIGQKRSFGPNKLECLSMIGLSSLV